MNHSNFLKAIRGVRVLGVLSLLVSGVILLWQGFYDLEGFARFLAFSGLNFIIASLGIFCARVWNEPKGARTLLAVATTGLSAQFAQVGGILYSILNASGDLSSSKLPSVFLLTGASATELAIAAAILTVMAVPIAFLTHKIFSREQGLLLSLAFLAQGVLLLLPIRETGLALLSVLIAFLALAWLSRQNSQALLRNLTFEKLIALAVTVSPTLVHVVRDFFYADEGLLVVGVLAAGFSGLLFVFETWHSEHKPDTFVPIEKRHKVSLAFASVSWICVAGELLSHSLLMPMISVLVVLAPLVALYCYLKMKTLLSAGAFELFNLGLIVAMCFVAISEGTLLAGIVSVVFGFLVLGSGFKTKRLRVFVLGLAGAAAGLVQVAVIATSLIALFSWLNLAVLGAVIILLASFLEKRVSALGDWQVALRQHFLA